MSETSYDYISERSLYHTQKHAVSSYPAGELSHWVSQQDRIALSLQRKLSEHPRTSVRQALARHPGTDAAVLEELFKRGGFRIYHALAENTQLPVAMVKKVRKASKGRPEILSALLRKAPMDDSEITHIIKTHTQPEACEDILKRSRVPDEAARWVFENQCHDWAVKRLLLGVEPIRSITEAVIKGSDISTMRLLARNPKLSASDQMRLAEIGEDEVLFSLSVNNELAEAVIDRIIELTSNTHVLRTLTGTHTLNSQQMEKLAELNDPEVSRMIASRVTHPGVILSMWKGEYGSKAQERVAANPHLPESLMDKTFDRGGEHQLFLAGNRNLPLRLQLKISKEGAPKALWRLTGNPGFQPDAQMPLEVLLKADKTKTEKLFKAASIDPDIWDSMARTWTGTLEELQTASENLGRD